MPFTTGIVLIVVKTTVLCSVVLLHPDGLQAVIFFLFHTVCLIVTLKPYGRWRRRDEYRSLTCRSSTPGPWPHGEEADVLPFVFGSVYVWLWPNFGKQTWHQDLKGTRMMIVSLPLAVGRMCLRWCWPREDEQLVKQIWTQTVAWSWAQVRSAKVSQTPANLHRQVLKKEPASIYWKCVVLYHTVRVN